MSDVNPIYEQRLLVFLEDIATGCFNQVLLSSKQFKKVSDAICSSLEKDDSLRDGFELATIETSEKEIPADVFIGCESIDKE